MTVEVQMSQLTEWANQLAKLPFKDVYQVLSDMMSIIDNAANSVTSVEDE